MSERQPGSLRGAVRDAQGLAISEESGQRELGITHHGSAATHAESAQRCPLSASEDERGEEALFKECSRPRGPRRNRSAEERGQTPPASKRSSVLSAAPCNSELRPAFNDILSSFQRAKWALVGQLHEMPGHEIRGPGAGGRLPAQLPRARPPGSSV